MSLAVAGMMVSASPVKAQVLYGSIVGNVKDAQGAVVPGATITITNKQTGLTRDSVTDDQGSYTLTNVLPGPYDVKVVVDGVPRVGARERAGDNRPDFTCGPHASRSARSPKMVNVESAAELLQTDKADVHTELKSAEITAMPLNQFRNYQALLNLVPGASPARFNNAETDTPARSLTTYVNGQSSYQNTTRTDGATNVNIWLPNHLMYVAPAETIDTVNVSTNNFDAEQGMAGGASVTVVTKSGTNQVKGSAFEFHNNEGFNATQYFFGTQQGGKPDKLPVTRNIYGGTVGGPIVKNKLFFFGSFEGYKSNQSVFQSFNVPNPALRSGDFSNARNTDGSLQIIYDPSTGNADGTGRMPFPNNQIPAGRINAITRQLIGWYPASNTGGSGAGGLTGNYLRGEKRTTDRKNYDAKVNLNRTSANQIWGKFSYLDALVDDRTYFLIPDPNGSGDGGDTKVTQLTGGQTWTLDAQHGVGRDVRLLAAEAGRARSRSQHRQLRPRHAAASPARTTQGSATTATPAIPEFRHRLHGPRQLRGLDADLPRRAHLLVLDQPVENDGTPRHPRRVRNDLPLPEPLAAGTRQPARPVRLHHPQHDGAARRSADEQLLQPVGELPARHCRAPSARAFSTRR